MSVQYRSLDRTTHAAIFLASLLVSTAILGSILTAFGPMTTRLPVADQVEEVVVRG